jgi:membrane fusion protein, multidrug efflux system
MGRAMAHRIALAAAWIGGCLLLPLAMAATPEVQGTGDKEGRIRAQFSPRNEVVISSEISAKIASLPLREGDAFSAGQRLVGFDCALFQAQLNKAQATQEAMQQTLTINRRLAELNSIGALELQQSEGRAKEVDAEVAFMLVTVNKCAIAAPFAGRIAKRLVANHQYVTPGTPLLGLIDAGDLEIQLIVPSRWLAWLKAGSLFSVQVDELGSTVSARVIRIGARIDPVSQSVGLSAVVDGSSKTLRAGMSGWATFPGAR